MGVVYEALQTEPVRRTVAVKLVRAGAGTPHVLQRFEAERQALAVMDHPHIAKVFDAGTTEDDEPYFVMERVQGAPLNVFCDQRRLGTWERLQLLVQVCDAVQHAHLKGVIHRDLKPSNILVSDVDGTPRPKIIDFGVAKAVGEKLTRDTLSTMDGSMVGTLAYMSPEQAAGSGPDVDSRADVYALGVILYELLVGRLPLDPEEMGLLPFLAQLATGETRAPAPSAQLERDAEGIAALRQEDVASLAKRLRGDLDWIAMRAIAAERDRRYPTATSLAEDIQRFLRDEPVNARPPTRGYRVAKFVKRNRPAVAAAGAALVILVAGAVTTTVGFIRATRAESAAQAARAQAELEAATAERVSDFLVGMFAAGDPGQTGGELTARQLLDRGVDSLETALANEPAVQGRLYATMGNAYFGLGLWRIAEHLHERALAARERGLGPDDPAVARSLRTLQTMRIRGGTSEDDPEILAMAERSFEIGVDNRDEDPEGWVLGITNLSEVQAATGRVGEGRELVHASLAEAAEVFGPLSPHTVHLRDWSAKYEANVGNYAAAISIFETMLGDEEVREILGLDGIEAMTANLGLMYGREGMTEKQVELYEEALAMGEAEYGAGARRLGDTYWNLAMAYADAERHDDAARIWETYVAAEEAVYGTDAAHTVRLRANMGFALSDAGRYEEAEAAFATALEGVLPLLGDERRGEAVTGPYFDTLFGYAMLLARTGRANEVWTRLLASAPEIGNPLEALRAVAAGLEEGGAPGEAIAVHDRRADAALERAIASGEGDDGEVRGAFIQSALVRVRAGEGESLIALGARWSGAMERLPGSPPGPVLQSYHDLSYHLFVGEHRDGIEPIPETRARALEPLTRALSFQERAQGADSPALLRQLAPLRLIREYRGEDREAAAAIRRARALVQARIGELDRLANSGEEVNSGSWNFVCWWGSLAGAAEEALPACERGVSEAPSQQRGGIVDSRAVAYALTGRLADAARDFRTALEAGTYSSWQVREQREDWADALERGENPFGLEALATLAF